MPTDDHIRVRLTVEERRVLRCGITEWGGPAHCTEEFARAMGFDGVADLELHSPRLREAVEVGEPLTREDWRRVSLMTEVAFASDIVGSGVDWATTTGMSDEQTIRLLRCIQRKVAGAT